MLIYRKFNFIFFLLKNVIGKLTQMDLYIYKEYTIILNYELKLVNI